jgi:hypothetical protein
MERKLKWQETENVKQAQNVITTSEASEYF